MKRSFALLAALAALAAIIAGSAFAGGNSGNAQACQQNGWQSLFRGDGTGFANQSDCVSYGANGGILYHGENFSEMQAVSPPTTPDQTVSWDQPTKFSGGTIDSSYGLVPDGAWWFPAGGVMATGASFGGLGPDGTHFLFTGLGVNTAQFTFTTPAKSVQVTAEPDKQAIDTTLTLTGYDANNNVVGTATAASKALANASSTLKITSASANIKRFTVSVDDGGNNAGLGISNILWS
jgi:hypothetical protein